MTLSKTTCALALLAATSGAAAADTRVYRCDDGTRITYSDVPCSNARVLSIDGGAAASDARERLRRDQDALDAGAAARRDALAREAAMARLQAPPVVVDTPPAAPAADYPYYDFTYPPLGTLRNGERRRDDVRERRRERREADSVITVPQPTPLRRR